MDVAKWLKHATDLGGSGRGRPPIMDLRRGVSAAYYALFHELSRQAAEHALPRADAAQISALRRSYSHGSMSPSAVGLLARRDQTDHTSVAS